MSMIIVGYQGIGKSTLASKDLRTIDLESSCTKVNSIRYPGWADVYIHFAESLCQQGYDVCVSSHKQVQDLLAKPGSGISVVAIFPSIKIKNLWIEKLRIRWETTGFIKDYTAWQDADKHFDEEIEVLKKNHIFYKYEIDNMDYDLEDILVIMRMQVNYGSKEI